MHKENGRLKPAEEKETANVRSKRMTYTTCGMYGYFSGLQFGEKKKCVASTDCDGVMEEDTDI